MNRIRLVATLWLLAGCVTTPPITNKPEEQLTAGCYKADCGEKFFCYCWDPHPEAEHSVYLERRCFGSEVTCRKELEKAER